MRAALALALLFPTTVAPATVDLSIVEPSAILRVDCYQGVDEYVGMAILVGMVPVIPGQSGGPVVSEDTGRVVGLVNAENFEDGLSWSVQLRDTPVCKQRVA